MSRQNHIVQKLTVEVGLSSQENAYDLQCRVSDSHDRLVLEVLSEVFDRLIGENEVVQIDKIEIDLGHIVPQHLDYEFPEKLKKEAEQIFTNLLHDLHQFPGDDREVRVNTSAGGAITVHANLQPKSVSLIGALAHFLRYGVLPWGNGKVERPTLRELVSEAMEKHPEELKLLLQQLGAKSYVFKRLALLLPEEQLQYLAAVSGCGFSSKLPAIFNALQVITEKLLRLAAGNRAPGNPGLFIRQESLRYFAFRPQTSANISEAVFTGEIIDRIMAQYGLEISSAAIQLLEKELKNPSELSMLDFFAKEVKEEPRAEKNKKSSRDKKDKNNLRDRRRNDKHQDDPDDESETGDKIKGQKEKNDSGSRSELQARLEEKLNENHPLAPEADSGLYIENAGMIILAPYLPAFFRNRGLVVQKDFVDEASKWKAVHLLQWLVYGDPAEGEEIPEFCEHDLMLNKLLCGMDIAEPVPDYSIPGEEEKEAGIELLNAVIQNWEVIKRSSVFTLRSSFLIKEGRLKSSGSDWDLFIQRDSAVDMLIDRLPWTISMIKMPWNKGIIYVEW